jgi:CubicO group peptidase (beta-lactamase class C family)
MPPESDEIARKINGMENSIYLLIGLIVIPFLVEAQPVATQALVNEYLSTLPNKAEIAIGIIDKGQVYKQGYHKKNGRLTSVENNLHIFEIGSITKTFTATLVLNQVHQGKLKLEDPFAESFPNEKFQTSVNNVQIRHLLTHTSGLADAHETILWPYLKAALFARRQPHKYMKWKHYKKYLKNNAVEIIPGVQWEYNNAGFALLGQLLEERLQKPWEELLQEQLLDELGMQHSYATGKGVPESLRVQGYDAKGRKAPYWDMKFVNPAGSMKSCVDDLIIWLQAYLQAEPETLFDQMLESYDIETQWAKNKMGKGWFHRFENGQHQIWHDGATGAFRSFSAFDPKEQTGIILLINFNARHSSMMNKDNKSLIREYGFRLLESL